MMTFEFLLTFDVNGSPEHCTFSVAAATLSCAVTRSLDQFARQKPDARFKGLTYYAPSALPWAAPTGVVPAD
jgi:hypothetical protein